MDEGAGVVANLGVGCRCGWDPVWLWLWHRPAAGAPIQPLAWEPPYAVDAALKRQKKEIAVCPKQICLRLYPGPAPLIPAVVSRSSDVLCKEQGA